MLNPEELFGLMVAAAGLVLLSYLLVRSAQLSEKVGQLERSLRELSAGKPSPMAGPCEQPAPVPPVSLSEPPPLPRRIETSARQGSSLARLRDLGLIPPSDLRGEYALGAWWAVRVGGVLAVVAAAFLGVWLNMRSEIPPVVRVLEVALVGAGLFWGGVRVARTRADLGQVVAAAGLAVFQFAAWSTYGLDRMRLFDGPVPALLLQFAAAMAVAFVALARGQKVFGQLAVIFASVAVAFSADVGLEPWTAAVGSVLVVLLGVILMLRGGWGSVALLALAGSQLCLLAIDRVIPAGSPSHLFPQLAAAASFLLCWLGERLVKDDAVLLGRKARAVFRMAGFFAPALVCLFIARGDAEGRAVVAAVISVVAALAGLLEARRDRFVSEIMLLSAVLFGASALAWVVDSHIVWLVWLLAASLAQVVGSRTGSELVRWGAEILAAFTAVSFIMSGQTYLWVSLAGVAALGALLSFREEWGRPALNQRLRRVLGIVGLATVVLSVQADYPKSETAWPWLVLLPMLAWRFRTALLWAGAPAYLLTSFLAVFRAGNVAWAPSGSAALWAAVVLSVNLVVVSRLLAADISGATRALRHFLSLVSAVMVFALVHHVLHWLFPAGPDGGAASGWQLTMLWFLGGLLVVVIVAGLRLCSAGRPRLPLIAFGSVLGFFIQGIVFGGSAVMLIGLAQAPFVLLGLACLLYVLATQTEGQGVRGTAERVLLGAVLLGPMAFVMLDTLPGAFVSLFWALAATLTFVIGHFFGTRSLRMLGLLGLVAATLRVLVLDITDLPGRVAACAAMASAFFLVAWLYGRLTGARRGA